MFKSVFIKIFFTYLSILAVMMVSLSLILTSLSESQIVRRKAQKLDDIAYQTSIAADAYAAGEITHLELQQIINAMGYIMDTKIFVIKAADTGDIALNGMFSSDILNDTLKQVKNGQSVFVRDLYAKNFDDWMSLAAYPWENNDSASGAILLFSPEENISEVVCEIQHVIWITAAAFILIGGFIIYFFSKQIVRPIKEIDTASRKMANSEPAGDIRIRSRDELGSLAHSFNSMKQKMHKNETLRQDLISDISHDLRTPITNINGFLSGMEEGVIPPEDFPKYIRIIREETRRLMKLTGEILKTAHAKSGNIELNTRAVSIARAVQDAVSANRPAAREKDITIAINVDKKMYVTADPQKIEQVLLNLIGNAVKYSRPNGHVSISATHSDAETTVCVEDNGIGIAEEDLSNIFERYYRADSETGGYGLGLCIAKTYVEAHGGRIEAQSRVGEGTRICFTLPDA